jgi:hypothetical protein
MMDADNNKQPEKRRNKKSNPEIHDRLGHDASPRWVLYARISARPSREAGLESAGIY